MRYLTNNIALCCFFLPCLMATGLLQAQIVKCGELWTNEKCEGIASESIKEERTSLSDQQLKELKRKREVLHEFTTDRLRVQREFSFQLDTGFLESHCFDPEVSLNECRSEIDRYYERLEKRAELYAQVVQNKVQKKKEKDTEKESGVTGPTPSAPQSNAVVVIHGDPHDSDRRWRRKYDRDGSYHRRREQIDQQRRKTPQPSPRLGSGKL